jgi:hypothetical protein
MKIAARRMYKDISSIHIIFGKNIFFIYKSSSILPHRAILHPQELQKVRSSQPIFYPCNICSPSHMRRGKKGGYDMHCDEKHATKNACTR